MADIPEMGHATAYAAKLGFDETVDKMTLIVKALPAPMQGVAFTGDHEPTGMAQTANAIEKSTSREV